MRNISTLIGASVLCIGIGILITSFLPPIVLVCFQALLLIIAGLLSLKCK